MSTNFHINAERECEAVSTGERFIQSHSIEVLQTNTKVTSELMKADDPLAAYVAYVKATYDAPDFEYVYEEDDIFCERDPISVISNSTIGERLAKKTMETVTEFKNAGWDIVYEGY